jgi:uncharacterized protein (TIGR03067 family)
MSQSFLCLLTTAVLAGDVPRDDLLRNDIDDLQGSWKAERVEQNGAKLGVQLRLTFEGDYVIMSLQGSNTKRRFTLDQSRQPAALDEQVSDKPGSRVLKSIYELEGDTLRICIREDDGERPTSFSTKDNPGITTLIVLKRERE